MKESIQFEPEKTLHLINGGSTNGDTQTLEQASVGSRSVRSWIVPKHSRIGDEVIINVPEHGLFATGRIKSKPKPRVFRNSTNRYGSDIDSISLIKPPVSLIVVQQRIPDLSWATYPRNYTTPDTLIATKIRKLIKTPFSARMPRFDDASMERANSDELKKIAELRLPKSADPKQREVLVYARSRAVRLLVLRRASGSCEWCREPAPFIGVDGNWYLESHHVMGLASGGADNISNVIALCPNCHRRTEFSKDAERFRAQLVRRLACLKL